MSPPEIARISKAERKRIVPFLVRLADLTFSDKIAA
jgi:hypothetical protein